MWKPQSKTIIFIFWQELLNLNSFAGQLGPIHFWREEIIPWYSLLIQSLVCWHFVDFWDGKYGFEKCPAGNHMKTRNHATWSGRNWLSKRKRTSVQVGLKYFWRWFEQYWNFGPLWTTMMILLTRSWGNLGNLRWFVKLWGDFGQSWRDLGNLGVIWAILGYYSLAHEVGRVRLQLWVFIRGSSATAQPHYLLE